MVGIQTLIFFDFETTGLIGDNPNDPLFNPNKWKETSAERTRRLETIIRLDGQKMPRVTEISFVSVPRQLFEDSAKQMRAKLMENGETAFEYVPIAENVHTRQVNPQLNQREWAMYETDRQTNPCIHLKKTDLEYKNTFGEEWPGIVQFLEVCPKPACIIAHNGVKFDFRLLYHELRRAALKAAAIDNDSAKPPSIPENVFFLDSLSTLMDIEMDYNLEMEVTTQNIDWGFVFSQAQANTLCKGQPELENTNSEFAVVHSTTTTIDTNGAAFLAISGDETEKLAEELGRSDKSNRVQKTPERKIPREIGSAEQKGAGIAKRSAKRTLPFSSNEHEHPMKFMRTQGWSPAKQRRINPKFFMRNSQTGDWRFDGQMARREMLTTRGNFRLETLHNRLFSTTPFFNHRAQADCEALMQICMTYGNDFMVNVDKNAAAFPSCFKTMNV